VVQHAVAIYEPRCAAAGVTLTTTLRSSRLLVLRRGEIMQVISNLIANSIYAMPNGGSLSITVEDCSQPTDGISLTVRDSGMGIASEDLVKVFDAFFTTRSTVGTGIGLYVAKEFIEGHGGSIAIESSNAAEDHGTAVRVFLPSATAYARTT
jgi:signal transduction histidine kinase